MNERLRQIMYFGLALLILSLMSLSNKAHATIYERQACESTTQEGTGCQYDYSTQMCNCTQE